VGISRDYPLKTRTSKRPTGEISGYKLIPFHPLKYPRSKHGLKWRGFVGISRDYPLKTRTSKQPIGEILGYKIFPSHPLKYPRSKQGLRGERPHNDSSDCPPRQRQQTALSALTLRMTRRLPVGVGIVMLARDKDRPVRC
jgi:hypothetical protein